MSKCIHVSWQALDSIIITHNRQNPSVEATWRDSSPKNENPVIIYSPSSSSNFFVLLNTKEDILKNVGNRAVLGHHWLPLYFFSYYGSQWCPKTALLPTSSKYLPLCSAEQRNWNYLRWVNDDRIFIFGWTIPLMILGNQTSFCKLYKIHLDEIFKKYGEMNNQCYYT